MKRKYDRKKNYAKSKSKWRDIENLYVCVDVNVVSDIHAGERV